MVINYHGEQGGRKETGSDSAPDYNRVDNPRRTVDLWDAQNSHLNEIKHIQPLKAP